ncbi:carboxypeptidase-like regulatory domain-containing protein [Streptomyces pathocidini]|uniref:carboxypeptidase-like regulatory domain-containing protein n=1 Tax=Streptomyces pathocidini TaxID=1650571 RepID=UPI0033CE5D58
MPWARRIDAGDGLVGRLTEAATGAALPNIQVTVSDSAGAQISRTTTDASGEFLAFAPPGAYTVAAEGVGYEPAHASVTVHAGAQTRADLQLTRTGAWAGTGRTVPGPQSQVPRTDIVLANDLLSLAISAGSQDPQLPGVTAGKPLDLAAVGHLDQIDWLNLPYASAARPRGGSAWQQLTVKSDTVEVVSAGGGSSSEASVRAVGAGTSILAVTTLYTIRTGEPWVTAETTFTNRSTVARTFWAGDVLDHDGAGQRSGVAGHGTITDSAPADFTPAPATPWIGMTGSDAQTYGLLYETPDFTAYACGIWAMSQREVTLEPGAEFVLRRRIAAVHNGGAGDPWGVLGDLWVPART